MCTATASLDAALHALANPTRRAVIERLAKGEASVSELAEPFDMALPSFMDHLQTLEASGLVTSEKRGRVRTVRLQPSRLRRLDAWLQQQFGIWEKRLDQLDAYVKTMETQE